ncbi:MAG: NAD(P)-dependent glycerol-3-phosphate dehydrogenase [Silicimonas sp.]|nr:NAD(P)-dependent glycerol-3-phosphate dehydrogenase [Silicimonas sp.]
MSVAILGGGAFGTALAIALSRDGSDITLWARDASDSDRMQESRESGRAMPGFPLPPTLTVTPDFPSFDIALVTVPAQRTRDFLAEYQSPLGGKTVVSCAKGIECGTGLGPVDVIHSVLPRSVAGCLTGPSFAIDIARGLPTALVLAMSDDAEHVQDTLTRAKLRIYRTSDVAGAQLGGALKNVIAIAAGIAIGAGLGDSARASVIARGFAEMTRYAKAKGARTDTLQGLSGLGDLVLTCTSEKSRNFAAGVLIGQGKPLAEGITVEGLATAQAVAAESHDLGVELPLIKAVAAISQGQLDISTAIETLLARPAGEE